MKRLTNVLDTYDLVINGGRVMDPETMYDDIANVGARMGVEGVQTSTLGGQIT